MKWIKASLIAAAALALVDAKDEEAARFYTRFGFIASPLREQQLLLLLKDARKVVQ